MEKQFFDIFQKANTPAVSVEVRRVGERPCGNTDPEKVRELVKIVLPEISDVVEEVPYTKSASTDCNIPLSLGIPAVCMGVYLGGGSHTREEWIEKESLPIGLETAVRVACALKK